MSMVQALPPGPLDIVGDIHGEYEALRALLGHLGYDRVGRHPEGRTLVFVGDFCDRGPDSPAVIRTVGELLAAQRAVAVLGNHEINLLRDDAKDGAGWFFDQQARKDEEKYAPFQRAEGAARTEILHTLRRLPLALERSDLRVVHATWQEDLIDVVRSIAPGNIPAVYAEWDVEIRSRVQEARLPERMASERAHWPHSLFDATHPPPLLHAHAEHDALKQMLNPLRVLSSGVERKGDVPFYSGGKWRFCERVAWWDEYSDPTPVVIGHYWRRIAPVDRAVLGKGDQDLFAGIPPLAWHGRAGNVFCVDYSVGGRWQERRSGQPVGQRFKLAALRWPERELQFDDGTRHATQRGSPVPPADALAHAT